MSNVPAGMAHSTFYVREKKDYAVTQEIYRHNQALYSMGELSMFAMLWRVEDFKKGYVRRCPRCYNGDLSAAADAYNQSTINRCPMCYGTTFEGGLRAKIIRPALFTDVDDQENTGERGTTYPERLTVETVSDFRFRPGDFVFRRDGSRYQLAAPTRVQLRTGFDHPSQADTSIGYAPTLASLEDQTSVAWLIPPNQSDLQSLLTPSERYPTSQLDIINGPLVPDAWTD